MGCDDRSSCVRKARQNPCSVTYGVSHDDKAVHRGHNDKAVHRGHDDKALYRDISKHCLILNEISLVGEGLERERTMTVVGLIN